MPWLARKNVFVVMLLSLPLSSVTAHAAAAARTEAELRIECLRPPTPIPRFTMLGLRTLSRLLHVTPLDDPGRADVYFALARYWRGRAEALARQLSPCRLLLAERRDVGTRPPVSARARHELGQLHLSELRYLLLIDSHPAFARFRRLDEVLFRAGALLSKLQRPQLADRFFQRLFSDHPQSRFLAQAYRVMADEDLRRSDWAMAVAHYEQVAKLGGAALRGYALYREGTCWLRRGDAYRALELFVSLLRDVRQHTISAEAAALLELRTRRAVVRAFAKLGSSSRASRFVLRLMRRD